MNKRIKIILSILVVIIVILAIIHNIKKPVNNHETIRIGAAVTVSGDASSWGEQERNALLMAQEEINSNGGIDGRNIELVIEDTKSTSKDTITAFQKLINFDKLEYVIGSTWMDSYPGAQGIIKDSSTLVITPSASATAIQQPEKINNLFSSWYRSDTLAKGFIDTAVKQGDKRIAIVFANDSFYEEFLGFLKEEAEKQGVTIVRADLVNPGTRDVKTLLSVIKSENVDAIIFDMSEEGMMYSFIKDMKNMMPDTTVYAGAVVRSYIDNETYNPYMQGMFTLENNDPDQKFIENYKKKFNMDPSLSASTAYDTLYIMKDVIENSKKGSQSEYLLSHEFDTVTFGKVGFSKDDHGIMSKSYKTQYKIGRVIGQEIVRQ